MSTLKLYVRIILLLIVKQSKCLINELIVNDQIKVAIIFQVDFQDSRCLNLRQELGLRWILLGLWASWALAAQDSWIRYFNEGSLFK